MAVAPAHDDKQVKLYWRNRTSKQLDLFYFQPIM